MMSRSAQWWDGRRSKPEKILLVNLESTSWASYMGNACLAPVISCLMVAALASAGHAQTRPIGSEDPLQQPLISSVLPDVGTTLEPGALRQQIERLNAASTAPTPVVPGWRITPSITFQEGWTDHVQGANIGSTSVSTIQPGVLVTGQTSKLQTTINYGPSIEIFSASGKQNRIGQNFDADALFSIIPEELYFDLRGFGNVQSALQGVAPTTTVVLSKQNEVQTQFYSAHPYIRHRFSDWLTGELGGSVSYTAQSSLADASPAQSGFLTNQQATTFRQYVSATSGPQFGPMSFSGLALTSQTDGTGVLRGAYRDQVGIEGGYALGRTLTLLAGGGWETYRYGGFPSYGFSGPDWDFGFHLRPNADSSLTIRYRRKGGVTAPQVDATYAVSAKTRVNVRYSEGVTTEQEELQTVISDSVLDPLGNPVDQRSGSPLMLINNFYGIQTNVARTKRASVTGTVLERKDTFSLSFGYRSTVQLSAPTRATSGPLDTQAVYGSINWQHDLNRTLKSIMFFQYGTSSQSTSNAAVNVSPKGTTIVMSVGLVYSVAANLDLVFQYAYAKQPGSGLLATAPSNLAVFGLRKTF